MESKALPPPFDRPPPPPRDGAPSKDRDARTNELRVNRRIRVKEVFVIASDGAKLGVMVTEDALKKAMEEGLDLVEVNPMSRPPVCKLMDYGKYKYDQKKKAGAAKKNQKIVLLKEVKLRPKTDDHDFDFKVKHIREFLAEGDKAKITIMFRGREITHPEIGRQVLERVLEAIKDVAMVESPPRMEGRNMFMMVAPGKPGQKAPSLSSSSQPSSQGGAPRPAPAPGGAPVAPGAPQGAAPSAPAGPRPMSPPQGYQGGQGNQGGPGYQGGQGYQGGGQSQGYQGSRPQGGPSQSRPSSAPQGPSSATQAPRPAGAPQGASAQPPRPAGAPPGAPAARPPAPKAPG